jgi:hypothetical protein
VVGQTTQHAASGRAISGADAVQGLRNCRFHRAVVRRIHTSASPGQAQHRTTPISGILDAKQKLLGDEPLDDTREGAWVHMQDGREATG